MLPWVSLKIQQIIKPYSSKRKPNTNTFLTSSLFCYCMLQSFCTSSETSITSHWQRQEPGRGVPALCAGLAAFIHLYNRNKAGLQGQEATPARTQDQLYLQFSLVLKMFGNRGTRASPGNLPQCLMSLVLARSPSRLT